MSVWCVYITDDHSPCLPLQALCDVAVFRCAWSLHKLSIIDNTTPCRTQLLQYDCVCVLVCVFEKHHNMLWVLLIKCVCTDVYMFL